MISITAFIFGLHLLWNMAESREPIVPKVADVVCVSNSSANPIISGDCVRSVADISGPGQEFTIMLTATGDSAKIPKILKLTFWFCELTIFMTRSASSPAVGIFRYLDFEFKDKLFITVEQNRLKLDSPSQSETFVQCSEAALTVGAGSDFNSQLIVEIYLSDDEKTKATAPELRIQLRQNSRITTAATAKCERQSYLQKASELPSIFSVTVLLSGSALVLATISMAAILFFICVRHEFDPKAVLKCPHQRDPESVLEKPSVRIGSSTKIKSSTVKKEAAIDAEPKPSNADIPIAANTEIPTAANTAPASISKDTPK